MKFNKLTLRDRAIFDKHFLFGFHSLSAYSFDNIYIWKGLYDIFWVKIKGSLCVFFKDRVGCFLYLPPLGKEVSAKTVQKCFQIMDSLNKNTNISRIENIPIDSVDFYRKLGYDVIVGGTDYICHRESIASLRGGLFKKKRSNVNYFEKNYSFNYFPYGRKYKKACIEFFKRWMKSREIKYSEPIYRGLLEDSFLIFKKTLANYDALRLTGRIITVEGKIRAVTIGYYVGTETFVVLFEVCDLRFLGISQYIFRQICIEVDCFNINMMDDSGLKNLRDTKLSYRPYKMEKSHIARYG